MTWALVLDPTPADSTRRVGGVALALRLALDAQNAGALAVVAPATPPELRAALADPRLHIPLLETAPAGARRVRVPASYLLYRNVFRRLAEQDEAASPPPAERDLRHDAVAHGEVWGFDPIDVLDAASARRAESALFRSLRKSQDGWTSRYLNRYISLAISRLLIRTPLRPNQISVGILAFGIAGAVVAAQGTELGLFVGALLLQTQSVLDGCDGEVSRVSFRGSRTGEWLDTIGDDLSNYGYFSGAAWGLYRMSGSPWYLAAGGVILFCGLTASAIEYRYLLKIGSGDLLKYPLSQGSGSGPFAAIAPLFKRDTFVFLTLVAAALGWLGPMLFIFAAGAIGILTSVFATELRMARARPP
jgi:phosphatidylglycerophosphate synthase